MGLADFTTIPVGSQPTQLCPPLGPGTYVTIYNQDIANVVQISRQSHGAPSIPIQPETSATFDASRALYGSALDGTQPAFVIPGSTLLTPSPAQIAAQIALQGITVKLLSELDWINVTLTPYNMVADGVTDNSAALASAMQASALQGIPLYFPAVQAGKYFGFLSPIQWVPGCTFVGDWEWDPFDWGDGFGSILGPLPGFPAGNAFITSSTAGAAIVKGIRLFNLCLDGGNGPATVDLIDIAGHISDVILQDVFLSRATGNGLHTQASGGQNPLTGRLTRVRARQCALAGFQLSAWTDCDFIDIAARGCGATGPTDSIVIGFCANSSFWNPRAEFGGKNGINCNGNGGYTLHNPTTDRNAQSGIACTGAGPFTSTQPIQIYQPRCRRDGSSGTGNGIAVVGAVTPVIVADPVIYTGVDDGGGGLNTPNVGLLIQNSQAVQVKGSGYVQANTTPINVLGGNTYVDVDTSDIIEATGTNSASIGGVGAPVLAQQFTSLVNANLTNAWTIGTLMKWRIVGRYIEFIAVNLIPGATGAGTVIMNAGVFPNMPLPANAHRMPAFTDVTAAQQCAIELTAAGALVIYGVGGTATRMDFAVQFPLD